MGFEGGPCQKITFEGGLPKKIKKRGGVQQNSEIKKEHLLYAKTGSK